jgi:hypothetical protein
MSGLSFHIASLDESGVLNVWVSRRSRVTCMGRGGCLGWRIASELGEGSGKNRMVR